MLTLSPERLYVCLRARAMPHSTRRVYVIEPLDDTKSLAARDKCAKLGVDEFAAIVVGVSSTDPTLQLTTAFDVIQSKYCNKSDNECAERTRVAFALFSRSRNRDLRHTVKNVSTQRVDRIGRHRALRPANCHRFVARIVSVALILSENVFEGDCQKGKIIEADDSGRRPKNKNQDQDCQWERAHIRIGRHRRRPIHPMCAARHTLATHVRCHLENVS